MQFLSVIPHSVCVTVHLECLDDEADGRVAALEFFGDLADRLSVHFILIYDADACSVRQE